MRFWCVDAKSALLNLSFQMFVVQAVSCLFLIFYCEHSTSTVFPIWISGERQYMLI